MIKIGTTLDKPTLDTLRAYSERTGVPQAEVIRRAVREYLARMDQTQKGEGR
jgi:metal-responsive CopG/Arc/MetJ family transcriptional regulator